MSIAPILWQSSGKVKKNISRKKRTETKPSATLDASRTPSTRKEIDKKFSIAKNNIDQRFAEVDQKLAKIDREFERV